MQILYSKDFKADWNDGPGIIKAWIDNVPVENDALKQTARVAALPFVYKWVSLMPDVHLGLGATIGSVIPTKKAVVPAAVGVDIGCGMIAVKTKLSFNEIPKNLHDIRLGIEREIPIGVGAKYKNLPEKSRHLFLETGLSNEFMEILDKNPGLKSESKGKLNYELAYSEFGTLGAGNHFIEICVDTEKNIWFMLHSGSRGPGNHLASYFIKEAKHEIEKKNIKIPDKDLAYIEEETELFQRYWKAVKWSQKYAAYNRQIMLDRTLESLRRQIKKDFNLESEFINCHHNYVEIENHFGEDIYVTRKGAISAKKDEWGIIPGSMGTKSYIVKGLGNPEPFTSSSHGAGRIMSRKEAVRRFTVEDHEKAVKGIECRKDKGVLDETPAAYKSIDLVISAQKDLLEVKHELKQIVCIKG
ncbi:MAG: RtcB family protein [Spirochaetia bacterium]|nr:RtcB family protein [Spirochaetia bacterium]